MLERLPIALAQVKAGNKSDLERLLNEIRKIVYSLYQLPIALAQVKAGNKSDLESLLNEIRKIVYSLYQSKQIPEKVYNNIIKSILI